MQVQALKVAKANQKPNQTKEQTKLIAQGIEKGIAEYKKQQNKKHRELDKARKQSSKLKQQANTPEDTIVLQTADAKNYTPWGLLVLSWLGFILYLAFKPF